MAKPDPPPFNWTAVSATVVVLAALAGAITAFVRTEAAVEDSDVRHLERWTHHEAGHTERWTEHTMAHEKVSELRREAVAGLRDEHRNDIQEIRREMEGRTQRVEDRIDRAMAREDPVTARLEAMVEALGRRVDHLEERHLP